jgi:hypothetical protein
MDTKHAFAKDTGLNCHVCGYFGTAKCSFGDEPNAACDSFLSWSDLWQREMAAIKRAQRATYIIAAIIAVVAVVVMILPNLLA